jgi:hypothetical protein
VSFQPRRDADRSYNLAMRAAGVRVLPAGRLALRVPRALGGGCLYDAFVVARRSNYNRTHHLMDKACPGVPQVCVCVRARVCGGGGVCVWGEGGEGLQAVRGVREGWGRG